MSRQPSVRTLLGHAVGTLRSEGPRELIRRRIPVRERPEAGERPRGCDTERELEARFAELDAIYDRIVTEGYRS